MRTATTWGNGVCPACKAVLPTDENPYSGMAWRQDCPECGVKLMRRIVEFHQVRLLERVVPQRDVEVAEDESGDLWWKGNRLATKSSLGFPGDWDRWVKATQD